MRTIFPICNTLSLLMLFGYIQNMVVNRCKHMKNKSRKGCLRLVIKDRNPQGLQ